MGIGNTSLVLFFASPPALWSLPLSSYGGSSPPPWSLRRGRRMGLPSRRILFFFSALRTYDMMWWLALGSGWDSLQGGQDSDGSKFVQQIGWENDKNGPKKCRTGRLGARWLRQGKTINETMLTDKGCSRTRPGRPLADISGGGCQRVT